MPVVSAMAAIQPKVPKDDLSKEERPVDFAAYNETGLHRFVTDQTIKDVFFVMLFVRLANSLCMKTFFQPDEYFQVLEPAWQMAFGADSGAWITWEWQHQLRSSLHPALFAGPFFVMDKAMKYLQFFPQFRAVILAGLPSALQAIFAAIGDFYVFLFGQKLYGVSSTSAFVAVLLCAFSPWEWFCSTRTFSSSLETTLTIIALYYWPWQLTVENVPWIKTEAKADKTSTSVFPTASSVMELRVSLTLAALACVLRPTNLLIWLPVLTPTAMRLISSSSKAPFADYLVLIREAILCGSAVLLLSAGSDYLYYGEWTFPAYHWLHFNLAQDLAVFYGRNAWHYYLSQGLPLLLTTYTPFALVALFKSTTSFGIPFILSTSILTTIASLSLISHKEVRFIFPLLPLLHLLAAPTVSTFFYTAKTTTRITHSGARKVWTDVTSLRPILMYTLLTLNVLIAAYATLRHQTGPLSVTKFLRHEYEELALDPRGVPTNRGDAYANDVVSWSRKPLRAGTEPFDHDEVFAGFLMPCHSTPWRSRLYHRDLRAWALGCEPPIGKDAGEREAYRDEADRFYDDPKGFLEREMNTRERPWPRYIVGFEGVGDVLKEYYESAMKGFKVRERWRGRSSDWHDDGRRKGDVVVWEFVDGSVEG